MMKSIRNLTLKEIIQKRDSGELSEEEIIKSFRERIEEVEGDIRAFVNLNEHMGKNEDTANSGLLSGVPVAVKDNMTTSDLPTTCCSRILEDYNPPYDAAAVEKLRDEGAVLPGKTNMDEFAMGATTEYSHYGESRNPWDLEHVPGGSSGGSAAAVAAGMVPAALGSDTGGSIRQPAAFCGVVGLKPTYGVVSRYGLIAFASSLDQIGPLTRSVEDAALLLNVISGHDERDSTSADIEYPDYTSRLDRGLSDLTFGIPREYIERDIDEEVKEAVKETAGAAEREGADVREISLPPVDQALAAYYIICPAEASSNLARYDGVQYGMRSSSDSVEEMYKKTRSSGFGPEVKRRIMLGTYSLSAGYQDDLYRQALKVRTLISQSYREVFEDVDVIITPPSPSPAAAIGEDLDPVEVYHGDMYTVPLNITGLPGVSLPVGFNRKGLPLGVQLIGSAFSEHKLLQAAAGLESLMDVPTSVEKK